MESSIRNKIRRELSWWYRRLFEASAPPPGAITKQDIFRHLPDDPVVIEAGAFDGHDTEQMSRRWPKATIYAFEPVPQLYDKVVARVGFRKNVRCFNRALGAHTGTTTLHVSNDAFSESSSILAPKEVLGYHPDIAFETVHEVPVTTLGDFVREQGLGRVDFLWLDLQGAEFEVLEAAADVLGGVRAIYTEVNHVETYEGAHLYPEVRALLEGHGFAVEREHFPWKSEGNVLFLRRDLAGRAAVK